MRFDTTGMVFVLGKSGSGKSTLLNIIGGLDKYDESLSVSFDLQNEMMATLSQINELIETMAQAFVYVGIVFAVFSSLLLLNFIASSVAYKKKEIGILRAIGARGKDVLGIFFKEAMIIALINFTIALCLTVFAVIFINNYLRTDYSILITLLNFGVRQIGLMLLISVGVALISSAIPVAKIASKRPIDAIRDK